MTATPLISVRDLRLQVIASQLDVVKDVSFDIAPGEIFGIVGESGSWLRPESMGPLPIAGPVLLRVRWTRPDAAQTIASLPPRVAPIPGTHHDVLRHRRG